MSGAGSERRTTLALWAVVGLCAAFVVLYVLGVRFFAHEPSRTDEVVEEESKDSGLRPQTIDDMKYAVDFDRNIAPRRKQDKKAVDADLLQPDSPTGKVEVIPAEEIRR